MNIQKKLVNVLVPVLIGCMFFAISIELLLQLLAHKILPLSILSIIPFEPLSVIMLLFVFMLLLVGGLYLLTIIKEIVSRAHDSPYMPYPWGPLGNMGREELVRKRDIYADIVANVLAAGGVAAVFFYGAWGIVLMVIKEYALKQ